MSLLKLVFGLLLRFNAPVFAVKHNFFEKLLQIRRRDLGIAVEGGGAFRHSAVDAGQVRAHNCRLARLRTCPALEVRFFSCELHLRGGIASRVYKRLFSSGLSLSYEGVETKGNILVIKDVTAIGIVASQHGKVLAAVAALIRTQRTVFSQVPPADISSSLRTFVFRNILLCPRISQ